MTNRFYDASEKRAARVNDLFAAIASRYDLINDLQSFWLHRSWKRRLVRLANPKPGERALDLCCGTGDIAFLLADAGAAVSGLDFSEPMLAMGKAKLRDATHERAAVANPQFMRGDAQATPFPSNHFDIVTMGYGLRNLASWERGLEEMLRVAKPGGRLLVLDFGKPDNPVWRGIYFAYLRRIVPLFGKMFCGDSQTHAYILESLNHYPAQRGVAAWMEKRNCAGARTINLLGGAMSINYAVKR
jgi:demethylmenaquinone methyltransferase / 2-methoxy-6-polyprenyl-1,4-benzoquinol methylase